MPNSVTTRAFHAMAKPSGSDCNLRCAYCFYLEKAALYPREKRRRMSDAVLEAYVRGYIASIPEDAEVAFTWQGGEPTLLGLDFYRRAVALQKRYGGRRWISNSFQTNGLLLDKAWCSFFKEHDFLIGLSLDGPQGIHDEYRLTAGGGPTHARVMRSFDLLRQHGVRCNALACVNRKSSREPLLVYEFLRNSGADHIQFLPVVERPPDSAAAGSGLKLRGPGQNAPDEESQVTDWSVLPEDYGRFLTRIFDRWISRDVGSVFVMNFEWALANFMNRPGTVCHHQPTCGRSVIVEHNGDVYACDHYVYPSYRLGNVLEQPFAAMVDAPGQEEFGKSKFSALTAQCKTCKMLRGCWGGCPKHRFATAEDGEEGLSYLCKGYHHFFGHVAPYLKAMSDLISAGRPAGDILDAVLVFRDKE